MNPTVLQLPPRASKPRRTGLTMVIDGGIPMAHFAEYIDFVKFGWGTAVVTAGLQAKIDVLTANGIGFYFGGTLFEKYVLQGRFDDYRKFCDAWPFSSRGYPCAPHMISSTWPFPCTTWTRPSTSTSACWAASWPGATR